jgi:signal transduction histidine kinase
MKNAPDTKARHVDAHVGSRIRQCRIDRGRSLQGLADRLRLRAEQLRDYEAGKDRITTLQLRDVADALDVPLSYFFSGLAEDLERSRVAETGWRSIYVALREPLLLSIAYYLGAIGAFYLGTLSDRIFAPFWPPNVILFCFLLFAPYRRWWLFVAAALPAHMLAELHVAMPAQQMAVTFATNCMVAFLSAFGVRRLLGDSPWFDNFQRATVYILITAVVAPAVAALGGAFVRIAGGAPLESYGLFWAQWYLANALANLTLGPAVLTWIEQGSDWWTCHSRWKQIEAVSIAICLAVACFVVGHANTLNANPGLLPALLYLPLPAIVWAAVRFGARGASAAVLIVTVLMIWPALNGAGLFVGADSEHNVLDLQLFLAALSVPILLLGASVDGVRRTEDVTRELARCLFAARDNERRRVGKSLHEDVAQTLVAAAWMADDVETSVPEARSSLKRLQELLQQSIREVRAVSCLLHPPLLDEAGLETALRQYVGDYSRRNSRRVELEVSADLGRLPSHVELAIFRFVEKALETVFKGSASEALRVKICAASASGKRDVRLTVEGLAEEPTMAGRVPALVNRILPIARAPTMDIANMRERVGRLGGQLHVDASSGRPVVRAIVPIDSTTPRDAIGT